MLYGLGSDLLGSELGGGLQNLSKQLNAMLYGLGSDLDPRPNTRFAPFFKELTLKYACVIRTLISKEPNWKTYADLKARDSSTTSSTVSWL